MDGESAQFRGGWVRTRDVKRSGSRSNIVKETSVSSVWGERETSFQALIGMLIYEFRGGQPLSPPRRPRLQMLHGGQKKSRQRTTSPPAPGAYSSGWENLPLPG